MKSSNYRSIIFCLGSLFFTSCSVYKETVYLSYISYDDKLSDSFPSNLNLKDLPCIVLEHEEAQMIKRCTKTLSDMVVYPTMPTDWAIERVSKKVNSFIFVCDGEIILTADDLITTEQYPLSITNYEMWKDTRDKLKKKLSEIKSMNTRWHN